MLVKCYCFPVFKLPTSAAPTSAFKAIPATDFPFVGDLGIFENNRRFREIIGVFRSPGSPRGKDYFEVFGDRSAVIDIGIYYFVLFRECKNGTIRSACNGPNAPSEIFHVDKIAGDVQPEKAGDGKKRA
jgi:hypothetical protein